MYAGRSASETVAQQAGRLSQSVLAKHCATPPLAPAVVVGLAYRVVRRPVYVAGRYLKLLRGIAQVRRHLQSSSFADSVLDDTVTIQVFTNDTNVTAKKQMITNL